MDRIQARAADPREQRQPEPAGARGLRLHPGRGRPARLRDSAPARGTPPARSTSHAATQRPGRARAGALLSTSQETRLRDTTFIFYEGTALCEASQTREPPNCHLSPPLPTWERAEGVHEPAHSQRCLRPDTGAPAPLPVRICGNPTREPHAGTWAARRHCLRPFFPPLPRASSSAAQRPGLCARRRSGTRPSSSAVPTASCCRASPRLRADTHALHPHADPAGHVLSSSGFTNGKLRHRGVPS